MVLTTPPCPGAVSRLSSTGLLPGTCRRDSWNDVFLWDFADRQQVKVADPVEQSWDALPGLADGQAKELNALSTGGVLWTHPSSKKTAILTLHWVGPVEADGNCLFTALQKSIQSNETALHLRKRAVGRFREDYLSGALPRESTDMALKNMYFPNISSGWGVNVVQEVKLLAKRADRQAMDAAIADLQEVGMSREAAAEDVFKERCLRVEDGETWAEFMSVSGHSDDEYDIVTIFYTEEGLMSVDENREGKAAAFGDDFAIESLATELRREIIVVQCHSPDAMIDESCLFFLPHKPRAPAGAPAISHPPLFLFMKGTDWCAGGADHYEPVLAKLRQEQAGKAAYDL